MRETDRSLDWDAEKVFSGWNLFLYEVWFFNNKYFRVFIN